MSGFVAKSLAAVMAGALCIAITVAQGKAQTPPTGTPVPAGSTTPAPSGTPWPAPAGIVLDGSVRIINPDGSFIPIDQRIATSIVSWQQLPGYTGVFEVERALVPYNSGQARAYTRIAIVPAAPEPATVGYPDTHPFTEDLQYQRCYRVRTVINGETGPFSKEACTIAPPSTGPVPPAQTSLPGHPLQLVFGPQPAGTQSNAGPDVSGLPTVEGLENARRLVSQALPASLQGYWVSQASLTGGPGKFAAQAWFRGEGDRLLVVGSWTKTGNFVTGVPANSPVTEARQTYIGGLAALTLLPTPAVVGGIGPRTIWLTDGATIWALEFRFYSSNDEALALAEEFARAVQTPGVPGTGSTAAHEGGATSTWILAGASIVIIAGGSLIWRRRAIC